MGGGRSWSPGRALPRVGQTAAAAAAAAAVSPHPPSFPSLPFHPGSRRPARRVSGSQVSAPTCAPSARPATFPAREISQLGAPAPPRRCSPRPGTVLRPRPLSLQPRLEAGAPRVLGFPDLRRSSSSAWPAGTLASERRRRQNWESGPTGWAPPRGPGRGVHRPAQSLCPPGLHPASPVRHPNSLPSGSCSVEEDMALTVDVVGPGPWGFRITGGRDFHTPIMVTKVTERGKAEAADLRPGDIILAINGESAEGMLHAEAQSKIRQSPSPLRLQLDRSQAASPGPTNGDSSVEVLATRFQGSVRTHMGSQSSLRSSCSSPTSSSPQPGSPFSTLPPSSPHALPGEAVVSRSFQSLAHSPGPTAADRFSYGGRPRSRQASLTHAGDSVVRVLLLSPGPPFSSPRLSMDLEGGSRLLEEDSEVYKMLQENREARVAPRQSSSFWLLQEALEAEERGGTLAFLPSQLSPQSSLPTARAPATPPKLHTCEKCSASIVDHAVRIQEGRYRHPGCYTCSDCGLNLKMRGHFWVGDELYCEKHARQRYSSPPTRLPGLSTWPRSQPALDSVGTSVPGPCQ